MAEEKDKTYEYVPGLAGVPCAKSSVCYLDGRVGKLQYRGYPVDALAEHCTYEEVAYLLLWGRLPGRAELESFTAELASQRRLKFRIIDMMKMLPESGHPMDALTAAVAALGMFYPGDHVKDPEFRRACAVRLIAKMPTIVAAWHRIRRGDDADRAARRASATPRTSCIMVTGEEPDPLMARALDVALDPARGAHDERLDVQRRASSPRR